MNTKDLIRLGVPVGEPLALAHEFIQNFIAQGKDGALLEAEIFNIVANPPAFFADELRAPLARVIYRPAFTPRAELPLRRLCSHRSAAGGEALPRGAFAPWRQWGEGLEAEAVKQMANACALPSRPSTSPRFSPPPPRWSQFGTSGSGNHFVEFGAFTVSTEQAQELGLEPGEYLALLTHSGSRGTGAQVCDFYSKRAMARHEHLPKELKHLAWLSLDDADGQEYCAAMNLMGRYAAANHALIHKHVAKKLGAHVILDIENHHNFAWKETHVVNGEAREVIVHRKGATPAGAGVLGIIPGSMVSPGYVVRGKGSPESLTSASHGAGRVMSRTKAMQSFTWSATKKLLAERGVELLSAGLDEVPGVYKDIHAVMAAQTDLVEVLGQFDPKLVKMCPAGDRAED